MDGDRCRMQSDAVGKGREFDSRSGVECTRDGDHISCDVEEVADNGYAPRAAHAL
jgi:hypothetical protein